MTNKQVLPKDVVSEQATTGQVLPNSTMSPDGNGESDQHHGATQALSVTNGAGEETRFTALPTAFVSDARPDPKPHKYPHLWQSYLWWYEIMEMRKRHLLRISSIERGKSNLDSQFEWDMLEQTAIDALLKNTKKIMTNYGKLVPVWGWVTSIKGLGGECGLAAQLLAQIDDIDHCPTVASLWRFAGYAVSEGKAEKNQKGEKSRFNRKLKGICYNIADQFIRQQTPGYVDIYYAEKERQRLMYPEAVKNGNGKKIYTDAHIHNRAWRKMIKAFLRDLWVEWKRNSERIDQ